MDEQPQGILFDPLREHSSQYSAPRQLANALHEIPSHLWLSPAGLRSYHSDRGSNYNEDNRGFGAEYDLSPNMKLAAGMFQNSIRHDSNYLGAALLGHLLDAFPELKAGVLLGAINGYPEMRHGGMFPMAAPMLTYEGKNFGLNFLGLPKVGNVSPVVAAQMKLRF